MAKTDLESRGAVKRSHERQDRSIKTLNFAICLYDIHPTQPVLLCLSSWREILYQVEKVPDNPWIRFPSNLSMSIPPRFDLIGFMLVHFCAASQSVRKELPSDPLSSYPRATHVGDILPE